MYNMSYVHAHLCVHVCVRTCTLLSGQKHQGYVVFDSIKLSPPEQSSQGPFIAMVFYIWIFVSEKKNIQLIAIKNAGAINKFNHASLVAIV